MAKCEVCGNDYELSFDVIAAGVKHTFVLPSTGMVLWKQSSLEPCYTFKNLWKMAEVMILAPLTCLLISSLYLAMMAMEAQECSYRQEAK